ncbi:lysozyme inhibitor LprI family protein, partial [Marinobacter nauticus]
VLLAFLAHDSPPCGDDESELRHLSKFRGPLQISELVGMVTVEKLVSYADSTHENDPQTMREIQQAEKTKMEIASEEMDAYLAEALIAEVEQKNAIQNAQSLWEQYANAHCDAVYERWSGGSVRFFEYYRCHKELILERTHVIWKEFLTYPDNTPPVLPDPKKWDE